MGNIPLRINEFALLEDDHVAVSNREFAKAVKESRSEVVEELKPQIPGLADRDISLDPSGRVIIHNADLASRVAEASTSNERLAGIAIINIDINLNCGCGTSGGNTSPSKNGKCTGGGTSPGTDRKCTGGAGGGGGPL